MVSRVAITDKALLAEANRQFSSAPSYSGTVTPNLKLWVQDGSSELSGQMTKGTSVLEVRIKEVDPPTDAGLGGVAEGEEFACLPRGFVEFSNCLGCQFWASKRKSTILLENRKRRKVVGLRC